MPRVRWYLLEVYRATTDLVRCDAICHVSADCHLGVSRSAVVGSWQTNMICLSCLREPDKPSLITSTAHLTHPPKQWTAGC